MSIESAPSPPEVMTNPLSVRFCSFVIQASVAVSCVAVAFCRFVSPQIVDEAWEIKPCWNVCVADHEISSSSMAKVEVDTQSGEPSARERIYPSVEAFKTDKSPPVEP